MLFLFSVRSQFNASFLIRSGRNRKLNFGQKGTTTVISTIMKMSINSGVKPATAESVSVLLINMWTLVELKACSDRPRNRGGAGLNLEHRERVYLTVWKSPDSADIESRLAFFEICDRSNLWLLMVEAQAPSKKEEASSVSAQFRAKLRCPCSALISHSFFAR